jgi:hypothetical protein
MSTKRIPALLIIVLVLGGLAVLAAQDSPAKTFKVKVTAEQANLREKPDIGSAVVQQIPEGTILEADRKEGEWYLVRYTLEDGGVIAGYIHESLVVVEGQPVPQAKPAAASQTPPPPERTSAVFPVYESAIPFEIYLSAAGSTVVADDLNKGAGGFADANGAFLGLPPSGSVGTLRLTYVLGLEICYRVSPWISIGVGLDFLKGWRSSRIDYPTGDPALVTPNTTTRPSVQAVPVKLNVRFYPRPDFYIRGTAAYYTVKAGYGYRFVPSEAVWQEWRGEATAHTLGMEVAAGGEWAISSKMLFFAEAGFRLAQLEKFNGTGSYRDSSGANVTEAGSLWYYQARGADGRGYNLLFVHAAEPSGTDVLGARKATLNLTGTTLKAGVKFRF